jgi:hypothetical protein
MSDKPPPPPDNETTKVLETDWAKLRNRLDLKPMPRQELVDFVLGVCDGKIFTMHHIPKAQQEGLISMVFMPIALGAFAGYLAGELENVGTIWEYYSQAGPRTINGYPMFMSFHIMLNTDWERALKAIDKEEARRKTSVLDDLPEDPTPV